MNRLTFHNTDGSFGVIGMNETNETEKTIACIDKLAAYEDTGKEPEECYAPDLCVGAFLPDGWRIDANYCNLYILASRNVVAWNPGDPLREFVIWQVGARHNLHSGKYCKRAEEAQRHFAWICFDWFTDKDRPEPELSWMEYCTHKVARYKGWLLLIDCMRDTEDTICLLLPDADWYDEDLLREYEDVTSYEPEWEVCSEREAVDWIDNYETNKACKKRGGAALQYGATREGVAMAMEAVREEIAKKPKTLKELRKTVGLTQQQLAERVGVAQSVISSYENSLYFPGGSDFIPRLVRELRCSYEEFFAAINGGFDNDKL